MASPELQEVQSLLANTVRPAGTPVDVRRQAYEDLMSRFPIPSDVSVERVDAGGVPGDWVSVPDSRSDHAILYLHAGGNVLCSAFTHRGLAAHLSVAADARVLIIDFRRAPEHPFPAALDDTVTAYRWLLDRGFAPEQMAIAGDSGGGALVISAMFVLREAGDPLPAAGISASPGYFNLDRDPNDPLRVHIADYYIGDADPKSPLLSPILGDLTGLPPILIQIGTTEDLVDEAYAMAEKMREAGVEVEMDLWEDVFHCWQMFAQAAPEGREAVDRMGIFVRKHTGSRVAT